MDDRDTLDALAALAHATRLRAYRLLAGEGRDGLPAGAIARKLGVAPTSLSGHLGILARAGLVDAERRGRSIVYKARPERLTAVISDLAGPLGQAVP